MSDPFPSTAQLQGWVDRIQAGDDAAREELLQHCGARLHKLAHHMLRSSPRIRRWDETDDVFQNAVPKMLRALRKVRPTSSKHFMSLATREIRHALIDLARHYYGPEGLGANYESDAQKGDEAQGRIGAAPDKNPNPSRLAATREFHELVDASLPEEEREVVDRCHYWKMTQAEAAADLGISERTVRRLKQSAMKRLHKELRGRGFEP